jgi:hypothetical protein
MEINLKKLKNTQNTYSVKKIGTIVLNQFQSTKFLLNKANCAYFIRKT